MANRFVSVNESFELPPLIQDKQNDYIDARFAAGVVAGSLGATLTEDPAYPGLYLIPVNIVLTPDPVYPGFYLLGV